MSRIIKFRAWNKTSSKWMNLKDCIDIDNYGGVYPFVRTDKAEIELMQYIGLKDKNGVEIYEHDICHITDGWGNEWTSSVAWGDLNGDNPEFYPAFDLEPQVDEELNSIASIYESGDFTIEVIGNIYENPDLIKASQLAEGV